MFVIATVLRQLAGELHRLDRVARLADCEIPITRVFLSMTGFR